MRTITPIILSLLFITGAYATVKTDTSHLNPSVHHQTIEGWGHGSADLGCGWGAIDSVDYQYINFLATDWGLTGTRIQEVGARVDGSGMDNGNCDSIDWARFQGSGWTYILKLMQYYRDIILAEGYQPSFYSSTGYAQLASLSKPWMLYDPGERAQQIWSSAQYMRDSFGLNMNYAVIANEPNGVWTPQILEDDIKAVGPRLAEHGLSTLVQFPECVAPQTSWSYLTSDSSDTAMLKYVGRISYHVYGTSDPYRMDLQNYGIAHGLRTAQTERDPANIDALFDDLLLGGVSYWEVAYTGGSTVNANAGYTSFTPSGYYYRVRQVLHYVRPGAVRIDFPSTDSTVRTLGFLQKNGTTAVVYNTDADTEIVTVKGLPPGQYEVTHAAPSVIAFDELGIRTVGADSTTTVTLGSYNIVTITPYAGVNLPPTIMTWGSNPGEIESPATTTQLSVTANDPERDSLTYHWSVVSQPSGANAVLATPTKPITNVSGLTAGGNYVFNVDVSDGVNTTSRKAYLIAYSSNQPPQFGATGFRLAPPYGVVLMSPVPGNDTALQTSMAEPCDSAILQANISDLENDKMTGLWSIVSQPAGGIAYLDTTYYIYVSYRTMVHKMSVPGKYVFKIVVTDPTHTVSTLVACTMTVPNTPPVIDTIIAAPFVMTLPVSASQLTAQTHDAENDLLRYWWEIKQVPKGANPVFDHQGLANSGVSGLTVPGSYTFTLRTFDDISMTTKDVRIEVLKSTNVAEGKGAPENIVLNVYPNPVTSNGTVHIQAQGNAVARIEVSDMLGRNVMEYMRSTETGDISFDWDTARLPAGMYVVRALTPSSEFEKTVAVVR